MMLSKIVGNMVVYGNSIEDLENGVIALKKAIASGATYGVGGSSMEEVEQGLNMAKAYASSDSECNCHNNCTCGCCCHNDCEDYEEDEDYEEEDYEEEDEEDEEYDEEDITIKDIIDYIKHYKFKNKF